MAINKNFFNFVKAIEESIQKLDEGVIDQKLDRKDILLCCIYPLKESKIWDNFFIHEKEQDYIPRGTIDFSGRYSPEDGMIHLNIIHHPEDKEYVFNAPLWAYLRGIYVDTVCHEIIHLYQFKMREKVGINDCQRNPSYKEFKCISQYDKHENGLYLIRPDEVECYAYNFASQLFRRYRDLNKALDALRNNVFDDIDTYDYYIRYIKKNSHVFKRLIKKTVWYLIHKYSEATYITPGVQQNVTNNNK